MIANNTDMTKMIVVNAEKKSIPTINTALILITSISFYA